MCNNLRVVLQKHKETIPVVAVAELLTEIDLLEQRWKDTIHKIKELGNSEEDVYLDNADILQILEEVWDSAINRC